MFLNLVQQSDQRFRVSPKLTIRGSISSAYICVHQRLKISGSLLLTFALRFASIRGYGWLSS
jgi:hypothetical protein